jgi:hypothetical protein
VIYSLDEGSGLGLTCDVCRDDIGALRQELQDLGATHVLTYDELGDKKAIKAKVKEWTGGQVHTPSKNHQIFCVLTLCAKRTFALV